MTKGILATVLEAPEKIVVREFPKPRVGPDEALLRIELAGVCASDAKRYYGWVPADYPIIMGHEILGFIEEIGEAAARRYGLAKDDRVVVEGTIPCGSCFYCQGGNYHHCDNKKAYGTKISTRVEPGLWGGYSQYMYLAPGSLIHKISRDIPAEAAVLTISVIANGLDWVRRVGGAAPGDAVVIQGSGQQGLAAVIAARESGASPIIVTGRTSDKDRFSFARLFGADHIINVEEEDPEARVREITGGHMADLVVDVTGNPAALTTSLDLVRKQGTIVSGGITGKDSITPIPMDKIVFKAIRLQGVFSKAADGVQRAIKLVESRKYPLEKMVSHRFTISETEQAIQTVAMKLPGVNPVKVIVDPWA